MEDTYSVFADLNKPYVGFGVFDGHSGIQAAEYAATNLLAKIRAFGSSYISEAFSETDLGFCKSSKTLKDGTTATIALIQNQNILIGNVGDSRAILISENS